MTTKKAKLKIKSKKLVKWKGRRTLLNDTVNHYGEPLTKREISLSSSTQKKQIYWAIRSVAVRKGVPYIQQIIVRPDTLDELIRLYYVSRGTQALEMDVRLDPNANKKQKKEFNDSMSKMPTVRKLGPFVTFPPKKVKR